MIPDNIEAEHIIKAIQEIDEKGVLEENESTGYDLVYDNKHYPPKYVISLANKYVNGEVWPLDKFSGGYPSNNFLKKLGFDIVSKNETETIESDETDEDNQTEITDKFEYYKSKNQIEFITFHPSYSYEEFVEGITVNVDGTTGSGDELNFKLKDGIFKTMVIRSLAGALGDSSDNSLSELINNYRNQVKEEGLSPKEWWKDKPNYVLIIDEINRGDISKIFGELITLIEADKRLGMENELTVTLPYSQVEFGVPPNLYIIGTMNTADKSIALIDVALRRRFGFIEKSPDFEILDENHIEQNKSVLESKEVYDGLKKSKDALETINERICADHNVGRDRQVGHSFLFKVWNQTELIMVWENEILPLLEEYYYGQYSQINNLLFGTDGERWVSAKDGIKGFSDYNDLMEFLNEIVGE